MISYTKYTHDLRFPPLIVVVFIILLLNACSSDNDPTPAENQYLESYTKVADYGAVLLQFGASQQGLSSVASQLKYDIAIYEIEYKTNYLGSEIIASGLIGVPNTNEEVPILSFQHGTIAANSDAPTESAEGVFYASFASLGYISLIPDFIGFGSSSEILHPYYNEDLMASSIIDMIRAAKEFIAENDINSDNRLLLAGYSEGGYATMVTHKAIEEKYESEFDLIASAPASGGYDLVAMKDYMVSQDTYAQPFYLAFVTVVYAGINNWTTLVSDLFNEPYASAIPALFDGNNSGSQINAALTTDVSALLTEDFRLNSNSDSKYEQLNEELLNNSPIDWQPIHPMYMYHGTADITVPFENSQSAYDKLISAGASADKVSFVSLEGANHSTGIAPYIISIIDLFNNLK
ncbi:MAG: lipase family protein [Reichenbachiella sp.]|uniref:alpha/beta hydrolase family protein n=1 Tax=Reichenbachiella sp. TaxID=2184521 RepID=UPI003266F951